MFASKESKKTVESIDNFLDTVDRALLIFKEGVKNYLYGHTAQFADNLQSIAQLENEAGEMRRQTESILYTQSQLTRERGDIMRLLEHMGHIVESLNDSLFQFEIERPHIPAELYHDFLKLVELSTLSVESVIPAAKAYFRTPEMITEKIHRVYFYERECNKQAQSIKRHVFHNMNSLKLSEKFHLRYFALHIETLSDGAEKIADQLSVMAIKLNL